jgi:hypothetical protein
MCSRWRRWRSGSAATGWWTRCVDRASELSDVPDDRRPQAVIVTHREHHAWLRPLIESAGLGAALSVEPIDTPSVAARGEGQRLPSSRAAAEPRARCAQTLPTSGRPSSTRACSRVALHSRACCSSICLRCSGCTSRSAGRCRVLPRPPVWCSRRRAHFAAAWPAPAPRFSSAWTTPITLATDGWARAAQAAPPSAAPQRLARAAGLVGQRGALAVARLPRPARPLARAARTVAAAMGRRAAARSVRACVHVRCVPQTRAPSPPPSLCSTASARCSCVARTVELSYASRSRARPRRRSPRRATGPPRAACWARGCRRRDRCPARWPPFSSDTRRTALSPSWGSGPWRWRAWWTSP